MHIQHIAEQLEAAHRDNAQTAAVRIISAYLIATKRPALLSVCSRLMQAYWNQPDHGLTLIYDWQPTS